MAIAFARLEFVKRSSGKNSCAKSAYNARDRVEFFGNDSSSPKVYDWSYKEKPVFHDVLIPKNANIMFKDIQALWNSAEKIEKRKDSQTAMELVLALPDDKEVSIQDRIHLITTFVEKEFVKHGLAAQVDIHAPENHKFIKEPGLEPEEKEHNWHAHVLITTRQIDATGNSFEKKKNRDLMPMVRFGGVVTGENWGKAWAQHQNDYFEEKGLSLRVDHAGLISQIHLGPKRMRGRILDLLNAQDERLGQNEVEFKNPASVLNKITEYQSVFTIQDLDSMLNKHLDPQSAPEVKTLILNHPSLVQLYDKETSKPLDKFTTKEVLNEEKRILRLADRLQFKEHQPLSGAAQFTKTLTQEQKRAFEHLISAPSIALLEGHAGTGKSHLMVALKNAYEEAGYTVRGLGPDNSTAQVLKSHGFTESSNAHKFLYAAKYSKELIASSREVWILDESGKLGNRSLIELLKLAEKHKVKLILSGNTAQLPSVERGGMFNQFCSRYGCAILEDIQRQKLGHQREMAKKLAVGDISAAFDLISSTGGVVWTKTREESMETLVKKWATDRAHFPEASTLMIAHSNVEVKVLNELARGYLKDANLVGTKEFECQTSRGTIFVSEGDTIVFRRNDSHLKVMNGTLGTLTKASAEEFVVSVKEEGRTKQVVFDPRKYNSFQLGYALTYDRSQGSTVDRAYILHSPQINKEMFYVGLTRHVRSVTCFVSTQHAKNLAQLKRQAMQSAAKESTSHYVSKADLEETLRKDQRAQEISSLKNSSSLLDQVKGYSISAFTKVKDKFSDSIEKYTDRIPDKAFYAYTPDPNSTSYSVKEVDTQSDNPLAVEKSLIAEKPEKPHSSYRAAFIKLTPEAKEMVKDYFKASEEASTLYEIHKSETQANLEQKDLSASHGKWKEACCLRNESAFAVYNALSPSERKALFSAKSLLILEDRAAKHKLATTPKINIADELSKNIEPLMRKLYPEGPFKKTSKDFRFGARGSLCVTHSGSKAGTFYDFERGEGGNLLQLIQKEQGLSAPQAKKWAEDFLKIANTIEITKPFALSHTAKKEEDWISLKPTASPTKKELEDILKPFLAKYTHSATHEYRDEKNHLLFCVLRLEAKDGSHKLPLPMSFGQWNSVEGDQKWALKGFHSSSGKNPIYNLHQLYAHPEKKVLIVEGEKTADAANKMLGSDYVCISWQGGAGAASKADWKHLFAREIVIWPDNDAAGFKAANEIVSSLKQIGIKSLKVVDEKLLEKHLPQKWDLADPLPPSVAPSFVKEALIRAESKAIGLDRLSSLASKSNLPIHLANEVLWRIDQRMRPHLEQTHQGKPWDIENTLLKEVSSVLTSKETIQANIQNALGRVAFEEKLLHQAMLHLAAKGEQPSNEFYLQAASSIHAGNVNTHKQPDTSVNAFPAETLAVQRQKGFDLGIHL